MKLEQHYPFWLHSSAENGGPFEVSLFITYFLLKDKLTGTHSDKMIRIEMKQTKAGKPLGERLYKLCQMVYNSKQVLYEVAQQSLFKSPSYSCYFHIFFGKVKCTLKWNVYTLTNKH